MTGFVSVGYFLFSLVMSLVVFILWLRLILRYFRVSALHPVNQAVLAFTNPFIHPFTRFLPKQSRYDWVTLALLVLVEMIKFFCIGWLLLGSALSFPVILIYTVADLIIQPCNLLFYAILIRVLMSWINPGWPHPIKDILKLVTTPILRFSGRFTPNISGLDLSPIIALVCLEIITIFIRASLPMHLL